ncbi:unnamed protein product, partial [marine sediment metagenome]
ATLTSVTIPQGSIPEGSFNWITANIPDTNLTANANYWIYLPQRGFQYHYYGWGLDSTNSTYYRGYCWWGADGEYGTWSSEWDFLFKVYKQLPITGHFRSQEKDLGTNCAFGKFYESHLSGQNYTFKVRKYSDGNWSDWVTVTNGNKIDLSNGTKVQYDTVLTSNDGITNPKVYDVKIEYTKVDGNLISQYHDCGSQITAWANFVANHTLNEQTITYAVRTSSYIARLDQATWYDVVPGGLITAPVNRYIQWKATLSTTDGTKTPV